MNKRGTPATQRPAPKTSPAPFEKIGAATLTKLHKLGLRSAFDLVLHLPLRYEDETRLYLVKDAPLGQPVLIEGVIVHAEVQYRYKKALICQVQDDAGEMLYMRLLHFYGSQVNTLTPGTRVRLLGELRPGFFGPEMVHPKYRIIKDEAPLADSLTPVYPTTAGLSQDSLRKLIRRFLAAADLSDTLPESLLKKLALPGFSGSVTLLHEPPPDAPKNLLEERTHPAWQRLKFDELLAQQLSMRRHYARRRSLGAPVLAAQKHLTQALLATLPFSLTGAQQKVYAEISHDLSQPYPMQRLLQGDVGSGKTIVAALAAAQALENNYQVTVMAPTEILAEQHFHKMRDWLEPLGIKVVWLSAAQTKKEKNEALAHIAAGTAQLAVGTHALFQDQVAFARLGLAVIDEQHRFGVHQRLALHKKGQRPHQLMMSATPIPRTLAMSYYADLDVSVIDELPPGRTPIVTKLVADTRREEVIARIRESCLKGAQAYWVCPLIEESEKLQLQTAMDTFQTLTQTFPDLSVGLVHGRMASRDKVQAMADFKQGRIQLLVATTVIEVGVDVPNASLMVIEHAERMGLAQLHQLRGRVGRGAAQSACILLYQAPLSDTAKARLRIIFEHSDGFEIARQDLLLRGPGELLGARQSGVPLLRIADLAQDQALLEAASRLAEEILKRSPELADKHLQRWLSDSHEFLKV